MPTTRRQFLRYGVAVAGATTLGRGLNAAVAQTSSGGAVGKRLDVRDFGASGDGTSLDHVPMQRAVEAAAAHGGSIHIPAGKYRIGKSIIWPSGASVSVGGDGVDQTTIVGGPKSGATFVLRGAVGQRFSNFQISDLTIDLENAEAADALHYHHVSNLSVRRVRFLNSAHKFVNTLLPPEESSTWSTRDNDHVVFEDCVFEHHRSLRYETVTISDTDTISFTRCHWSDCQFAGVLLYQLTDHASFSDCEFDRILFNTPSKIATGLLYGLSCRDVSIERCRFTRIDGLGVGGAASSDHGTFGYESAAGVRLDQCTFRECGQGYTVGGVTGFRDNGSVVEFCRNAGVKISSAYYQKATYPPRDILIQNTIIRNNNQSGIVPQLHPGLIIDRRIAGYDLDMRLVDCQIYDDQPRHTQLYAVTADGGPGPAKTFRGISVDHCRLEGYVPGAGGITPLNATLT